MRDQGTCKHTLNRSNPEGQPSDSRGKGALRLDDAFMTDRGRPQSPPRFVAIRLEVTMTTCTFPCFSRTSLGHDLRHRRRPSWRNACGNDASCRPSSRCAWPTAWPPSSCRPSWRTPSCATHVSWAPWFQRLETTNERQLCNL